MVAFSSCWILCLVVLLAPTEHSVVKSETSVSRNETYVTRSKQPKKKKPTGGVQWSDVSVVTRKGVQLVKPTSFRVANGRVCGLLGSSGSGKSTLLSAILAGTTASKEKKYLMLSSGLIRAGQVSVFHENGSGGGDDEETALVPWQVAWLQQQDEFFELLTVRETLDLAAFLELPHVAVQDRHALVQSLLESLGLKHVANRKIGSWFSFHDEGRLSGGERRRLSVALELVTEKTLVLADEPTTGESVS